MHYIHRLTPRQKTAAIVAFVAVPVLLLIMLFLFWGHNQRLFSETLYLKTLFKSAQGIDTATPVSFSGIQIGRVSDLRLNDEGAIEVTMKIDMQYRERIPSDSVAELATLGIIGKKEIRIRQGSKKSALVGSGDYLASLEPIEVENIMETVNPLIKSTETILAKFEEILGSFPDSNRRIEEMMERINTISKRVEEAAMRLPEMAGKTNEALERVVAISKKGERISDNAELISVRAERASRELADLPEMQRRVKTIVTNLDDLMKDFSDISPSLKNTANRVEKASDKLEGMSERLPVIMDDLESTLRETLMIVESMKASWPVKDLVPEPEKRPAIDPTLRESPYTPAPR